jgi:RhtB (resistance to homoserine/threonine) family protein
MGHLSIYAAQWLTLIAVFSLAVVSPGPDFVVAVRNSLVHSRRIGILTAAGFGVGVLVHATYTVLGLAAVIAKSLVIFTILKLMGAAYLVYLGVQALRSKGTGRAAVDQALGMTVEKPMTGFEALRSGFLTNVLNPKATLFFLAIFSQVIDPHTPFAWQALYGVTCAVMVTVWFSFVAVLLTQARVRNLFLRSAKWLDRICGTLMIALGIKVAFSSR